MNNLVGETVLEHMAVGALLQGLSGLAHGCPCGAGISLNIRTKQCRTHRDVRLLSCINMLLLSAILRATDEVIFPAHRLYHEIPPFNNHVLHWQE